MLISRNRRDHPSGSTSGAEPGVQLIFHTFGFPDRPARSSCAATLRTVGLAIGFGWSGCQCFSPFEPIFMSPISRMRRTPKWYARVDRSGTTVATVHTQAALAQAVLAFPTECDNN